MTVLKGAKKFLSTLVFKTTFRPYKMHQHARTCWTSKLLLGWSRILEAEHVWLNVLLFMDLCSESLPLTAADIFQISWINPVVSDFYENFWNQFLECNVDWRDGELWNYRSRLESSFFRAFWLRVMSKRPPTHHPN